MKNETARREIESLDYYLQNHTDDYSEESHTAMMMAVKALEQESFKPMVEIDLYSVIKQKYIERDVLDKIRAEIKSASHGKWYVGRIDGKTEEVLLLDEVLQIIDKYREG